MQAFERTVLIYDPHNPPAWQVERGNLRSDMLRPGGPTTVNDIERPSSAASIQARRARTGHVAGNTAVTLGDAGALLVGFGAAHGHTAHAGAALTCDRTVST